MKKNINEKNRGRRGIDLKNKTVAELKEMLDRQHKICNNRTFLSKLPDNGLGVIDFKHKLENELKRRNNVDSAEQLLSKLDLNGVPQEIEWTGDVKPSSSGLLDSDDDSDGEVDPLRLIATHSGTQTGVKKKENPLEQSLVTSADVEEVTRFGNKRVNDICKKYDSRTEPPTRYKPNQPKNKDQLKSAFRESSVNVQSKLGEHWEVTAATPPVPVHGDVKGITLAQSLALQVEHVHRLKEMQLKEAMARLQQSTTIRTPSALPVSNLMSYRTPVDPTALFEETPQRESSDDLLDGDEAEQGGAVFYNIVDDIPGDT